MNEKMIIDNSLAVTEQYDIIKSWYPNKVILFQIGAFYEIFGHDAKKCSKVLDIKETVKKYKDKAVPMCGFTVKSKSEYIKKFMKNGFSVVIVNEKGKVRETFGDQNENDQKGKLVRYVSDIVTPSTSHICEDFSYSWENSYVASIVMFGKGVVILFADLSTSEAFFEYTESHKDAILRKLLIYNCREIALSFDMELEINDYNLTVNKFANIEQSNDYDFSLIEDFKDLMSEEKNAFYQLFEYIKQIKKGIRLSITNVSKRYDNLRVYIPFSTLYGLGIVDKNNAESAFSLLAVLNKTITPAGNRSLIGMLLNPVHSKVHQRHQIIDFFLQNRDFANEALENLGQIKDIDRICFRILNKTERIDEIFFLKEGLLAMKSLCSSFFEKNVISKLPNLNLSFIGFLDNFDFSIFNFSEKPTKDERFMVESVVSDFVKEIKVLSKFCGFIDAMLSITTVCRENNWVKPTMIDENKINITSGYHPILKAKCQDKELIENDFMSCRGTKYSMITGANMCGKSLFLKQVGLIVFMSQIGIFVPCEKLEIGKIDAIIARIGSSDDISQGKSTFYIELEEIAEMTNKSTSKSLCLIDEIGRGTSFEEGLALSKKIIEYISKNNKSHIICTTHVHKLAEFVEEKHKFRNFYLQTLEKDGELFFTYKMKNGICLESFAKNVAKMVNLPKPIWEDPE